MSTQTITITATVPAWLPSHRELNELVSALERGESARIVDMLSFVTHDMSHTGYTKVGEAAISVVIESRDALTTGAIAALNLKLDQLRAAYQQKQAEILERISKLQALEYVSEA
jgi:hypothetical protein